MTFDPASAPPARPPWGFAASIAWGLAGILVWFIAQFATLSVYVATRDPSTPFQMEALKHDGFVLALVTIIAAPAWVAVSVLASRLRGWRASDYLALVAPRRSEIAFGVACLAVLLIAMDATSYALGRDLVPPFMVESYKTARSSGSLVFFVIAIVIAAPISEEIAFRGFLFRGLSASFLGVAGTLVLTSGAWAMMHIQYDMFQVVQIFLIGLMLGWLRWASGSTLLVIGLHMLANLAATLQAVIKVEWMS